MFEHMGPAQWEVEGRTFLFLCQIKHADSDCTSEFLKNIKKMYMLTEAQGIYYS